MVDVALGSAFATGFTTSRTMGARIQDIKNVKEFGATGDGTTDDTAAVQAAVNYTTSPYAAANRGLVYFPVGTYKVTSPITYEFTTAGITSIGFVGAPGARITGSIAGDFILKRSPDTPVAGVFSIETLQIYNTSTTGKGISMDSCIGGVIKACEINAWQGIQAINSQSVVIEGSSVIRGVGTKSTSIGILCGNAISIIGCDVVGYGKGVVHQNAGLTVIGGRFEVNDEGIRLGEDENGNAFQTQSFALLGMSMEQNGTAIYVRAAAAGLIQGNSGSGVEVDYGVRLVGAQDVKVSWVAGSSGGFTGAGISVEGATRVTLENCSTASWNLASGLSSYECRNCNNPSIAIASLPTSPVVGERHWVTDANSPSLGSTVASGGATDCIVEWAPSAAWKVVAI